jgi:hypothetical protein
VAHQAVREPAEAIVIAGYVMKWIRSEVAPKVCSLLVDDHGACIGMVEYEKYARSEDRWKAIEMPSCNTVGRAQTKVVAKGLLLAHLSKRT